MPSEFTARLMGVVEGCTNPESAELLPDGETFVFGNCTMSVSVRDYRGGGGPVYRQGQAFISRARIASDGSVSLDERHLITGLTGTLGCDVLHVATSRFPAGTVFIEEGGKPITADGDTLVENARPRALAFDPVAGSILGDIPLDDDSVIAERFNGLDQPNGIGIDSAGNLYVGDIPNSNPDPDPAAPAPVPSAVYRIPHDALDGLAGNEPGAADGVARVVMPGNVNGICISPLDDTCWAVSCSRFDPVKGGIYNLTAAAFDSGVQPDPLVRDLGILDGVGITRRGTVLASNPVTGQIFAFRTDGEALLLSVTDNPIAMPADFNVVYPKALGGEPALLVPDISMGKPPETGVVAVFDINGL